MQNDNSKELEEIEEKLKKKERPKKKHKISGRSVFKLQEIIKDKSKADKKDRKEENSV